MLKYLCVEESKDYNRSGDTQQNPELENMIEEGKI
jgi:hypothetical protein